MYGNVFHAFTGRLDVLVNNTAHMKPYQSCLDTDPDVYWRTYEVNVHGLFNMARMFPPILLWSSTSHNSLCTVINVSSSSSLTACLGSGSYRSSKLAILRWTETLQLECEDKSLVAYCINPVAIKTKITDTASEEVRNKFPDRPEIAGDIVAWLAAERREWLRGGYVNCPWDM